MKKRILLYVVWLMLQGFCCLQAQSEVTFQINISQALDGREFDRERDRVELIGNRNPLSATQPIQMKPDGNNSNLFRTTVTFPSNLENRTLEFQFRLMLNNWYHNEGSPRSLQIPRGDCILDSLEFNSYAW